MSVKIKQDIFRNIPYRNRYSLSSNLEIISQVPSLQGQVLPPNTQPNFWPVANTLHLSGNPFYFQLEEEVVFPPRLGEEGWFSPTTNPSSNLLFSSNFLNAYPCFYNFVQADITVSNYNFETRGGQLQFNVHPTCQDLISKNIQRFHTFKFNENDTIKLFDRIFQVKLNPTVNTQLQALSNDQTGDIALFSLLLFNINLGLSVNYFDIVDFITHDKNNKTITVNIKPSFNSILINTSNPITISYVHTSSLVDGFVGLNEFFNFYVNNLNNLNLFYNRILNVFSNIYRNIEWRIEQPYNSFNLNGLMRPWTTSIGYIPIEPSNLRNNNISIHTLNNTNLIENGPIFTPIAPSLLFLDYELITPFVNNGVTLEYTSGNNNNYFASIFYSMFFYFNWNNNGVNYYNSTPIYPYLIQSLLLKEQIAINYKPTWRYSSIISTIRYSEATRPLYVDSNINPDFVIYVDVIVGRDTTRLAKRVNSLNLYDFDLSNIINSYIKEIEAPIKRLNTDYNVTALSTIKVEYGSIVNGVLSQITSFNLNGESINTNTELPQTEKHFFLRGAIDNINYPAPILNHYISQPSKWKFLATTYTTNLGNDLISNYKLHSDSSYDFINFNYKYNDKYTTARNIESATYSSIVNLPFSIESYNNDLFNANNNVYANGNDLWINYLANLSVMPVDINLNSFCEPNFEVNIVYNNGQIEQKDITSILPSPINISDNNIYLVSINLDNILPLLNIEFKNVKYISMRIYSNQRGLIDGINFINNSVSLINERTYLTSPFVINLQEVTTDVYSLLFQNRFGVYENFHFEAWDNQYNITSMKYDESLSFNVTKNNRGKTNVYNVQGENTITLTTGLLDYYQMNFIKEMATSRVLYIKDFNNISNNNFISTQNDILPIYRKVIIESVEWRVNNIDKLYLANITFRYANDPEFNTPRA